MQRVQEETISKLTQLWDEIGTDVEERKEHLCKLSQEVQQLFYNTLKQEQAVRDSYTQNILRLVDALLSICTALGEELHIVPFKLITCFLGSCCYYLFCLSCWIVELLFKSWYRKRRLQIYH